MPSRTWWLLLVLLPGALAESGEQACTVFSVPENGYEDVTTTTVNGVYYVEGSVFSYGYEITARVRPAVLPYLGAPWFNSEDGCAGDIFWYTAGDNYPSSSCYRFSGVLVDAPSMVKSIDSGYVNFNQGKLYVVDPFPNSPFTWASYPGDTMQKQMPLGTDFQVQLACECGYALYERNLGEWGCFEISEFSCAPGWILNEPSKPPSERCSVVSVYSYKDNVFGNPKTCSCTNGWYEEACGPVYTRPCTPCFTGPCPGGGGEEACYYGPGFDHDACLGVTYLRETCGNTISDSMGNPTRYTSDNQCVPMAETWADSAPVEGRGLFLEPDGIGHVASYGSCADLVTAYFGDEYYVAECGTVDAGARLGRCDAVDPRDYDAVGYYYDYDDCLGRGGSGSIGPGPRLPCNVLANQVEGKFVTECSYATNGPVYGDCLSEGIQCEGAFQALCGVHYQDPDAAWTVNEYLPNEYALSHNFNTATLITPGEDETGDRALGAVSYSGRCIECHGVWAEYRCSLDGQFLGYCNATAGLVDKATWEGPASGECFDCGDPAQVLPFCDETFQEAHAASENPTWYYSEMCGVLEKSYRFGDASCAFCDAAACAVDEGLVGCGLTSGGSCTTCNTSDAGLLRESLLTGGTFLVRDKTDGRECLDYCVPGFAGVDCEEECNVNITCNAGFYATVCDSTTRYVPYCRQCSRGPPSGTVGAGPPTAENMARYGSFDYFVFLDVEGNAVTEIELPNPSGGLLYIGGSGADPDYGIYADAPAWVRPCNVEEAHPTHPTHPLLCRDTGTDGYLELEVANTAVVMFHLPTYPQYRPVVVSFWTSGNCTGALITAGVHRSDNGNGIGGMTKQRTVDLSEGDWVHLQYVFVPGNRNWKKAATQQVPARTRQMRITVTCPHPTRVALDDIVMASAISTFTHEAIDSQDSNFQQYYFYEAFAHLSLVPVVSAPWYGTVEEDDTEGNPIGESIGANVMLLNSSAPGEYANLKMRLREAGGWVSFEANVLVDGGSVTLEVYTVIDGKYRDEYQQTFDFVPGSHRWSLVTTSFDAGNGGRIEAWASSTNGGVLYLDNVVLWAAPGGCPWGCGTEERRQWETCVTCTEVYSQQACGLGTRKTGCTEDGYNPELLCGPCPDIPVTASYVEADTECEWECTTGQWRNGTVCKECTTGPCDVGFYRAACGKQTDSECVKCTGIDAFSQGGDQADYTSAGDPEGEDNCAIACNSGYYKSGSACEPCTVPECGTAGEFQRVLSCRPERDAQCASCGVAAGNGSFTNNSEPDGECPFACNAGFFECPECETPDPVEQNLLFSGVFSLFGTDEIDYGGGQQQLDAGTVNEISVELWLSEVEDVSNDETTEVTFQLFGPHFAKEAEVAVRFTTIDVSDFTATFRAQGPDRLAVYRQEGIGSWVPAGEHPIENGFALADVPEQTLFLENMPPGTYSFSFASEDDIYLVGPSIYVADPYTVIFEGFETLGIPDETTYNGVEQTFAAGANVSVVFTDVRYVEYSDKGDKFLWIYKMPTGGEPVISLVIDTGEYVSFFLSWRAYYLTRNSLQVTRSTDPGGEVLIFQQDYTPNSESGISVADSPEETLLLEGQPPGVYRFEFRRVQLIHGPEVRWRPFEPAVCAFCKGAARCQPCVREGLPDNIVVIPAVGPDGVRCEWECAEDYIRFGDECVLCTPVTCPVGQYEANCSLCENCTSAGIPPALHGKTVFTGPGAVRFQDSCPYGCAAGYYQRFVAGEDCENCLVLSCEACSTPSCAEGRFLEACTSQSDARCVPCATCSPGTFESSACSPSANTECRVCEEALPPGGTWVTNCTWACLRDGLNASQYIYNFETGACQTCLPSCAIGSFSTSCGPGNGWTGCEPCVIPGGAVARSAGVAWNGSCMWECPPSTVYNASARVCSAAPTVVPGPTACDVTCIPGRRLDGTLCRCVACSPDKPPFSVWLTPFLTAGECEWACLSPYSVDVARGECVLIALPALEEAVEGTPAPLRGPASSVQLGSFFPVVLLALVLFAVVLCAGTTLRAIHRRLPKLRGRLATLRTRARNLLYRRHVSEDSKNTPSKNEDTSHAP